MTSPAAARIAHDRRQRRMLVALALLFFAPLAVSFFLYYGPWGWRPGRHVNHGDLIDPPRPLPEVSLPIARADSTHADGPATLASGWLKNRWTLLYVGPGRCGAACRRDLYNMRQVRIALNRDMDRVQRVFIAEGDCCDWALLGPLHPDLETVRATAAATPLLARLPTFDGIPAEAANRVYLIDPLGNLMMSFAPDAEPKGMLADLKRLLGLSHVG